jgi:hypothetical protein
MRGDARLNLLLTPPPSSPSSARTAPAYERGDAQPWHRTLSQLLVPLGVRTFEARSGPEAVELMERHPIHLAVVDTRLPAIGGLNVLQLIQRLHAQGQWTRNLPAGAGRPGLPPETEGGTGVTASASVPQPSVGPVKSGEPTGPGVNTFQFHMEVEHGSGETTQRFQVRIDARVQQQAGPVVILIAPPPAEQDKQLLQEALKFNAFSVLSEPVDVNLALQVMARAMTRCFAGLWPC